MKTSITKRKAWLAPLALALSLVAFSQVFVACGSKGDSGATAVIPPGAGINPTCIAPCIGGINQANLLASGIGRMISYAGTPGYEIQVQLVATGPVNNSVGIPGASPILNGGLGSQYYGPIQIAGLMNVFPIAGSALCMPAPGTYTFSTGVGNFDSSSYGFQGQVQAAGPSGVIMINFYNTFLRSVVPAAVSLVNSGQSFPFQILNQVQLSGIGVQTGGFNGQPIQCGLGGNPDFLGAF